MKILSIHDGHNATACYMRDGRVVSIVSEERFTNLKNHEGFPGNSVNWILAQNAMSINDFDFIVIPHLVEPFGYKGYCLESFRRRLFIGLASLLPSFVIGSNHLIGPYIKYFGIARRRKLKLYSKLYGFQFDKVCQVEHHLAHGYAALYGSGFVEEGKPILIFTCDGSGDGLSSTVATWNPKSGYERIQKMQSFHSIGELFLRVTQFLGMKPTEHEYKIMGMAPYVPNEYSQRCYEKFLEYVDIDDSARIVNKKYYGAPLIKSMKKDFSLERFDNICGGIQRHLEHIITTWVRYWSIKTGIRKAVFGGGVFMNVKANMLISEIEELDDVFFCPSCGDESTAIGAAYNIAEQKGEGQIYPLESLYKGPCFEDDVLELVLDKYKEKVVWKKYSNIEKEIAKLLKEGRIVARFKGPAEWGARALGGRSILCRADDLRIIHRLNKSIKMRDFWMPFAPSIIEEDADRYIMNPEGLSSRFMMLSFHTTDIARDEICAALHPFDNTCRVQLVSKDTNSSYHLLLKYFKELTGYSGFLNTSFNLHGYPIVGTPEMAVKTLLNSKLDVLAMENYLVERRGDKDE